MVGWHHRLNGHGFEWTLRVGDGHGGLACMVHGVTESDTTERLISTGLNQVFYCIIIPHIVLSHSVMYGCESWTIMQCRRIDAFELWYWRRLLRVPWTARRSNQSILKEIRPGCSLVGLMLKLKLPILWPPGAKS